MTTNSVRGMATMPLLLKADGTKPLPTFNQAIGALIAKRRIEVGLSTDELARRSGVGRNKLYRVQNGYGRYTLGDHLAIANALDIEPSRLLPEAGTYLKPGWR